MGPSVAAAFVCICGFLLAVPLVALLLSAVADRCRKARSRPGFEVKLIPGSASLMAVPVLPTKEDDHG